MSDDSKADRGAQPEGPAGSAAGAPAIVEVLRQLHSKTGVWRGVQALSRMNQAGGFDCPGCAWPEDPQHRKHAEFCENGAKAFADEATRQLVNADFFARYSIAELAQMSGQRLNEQGRLGQPMVRRAGASHYTPITWFGAFELIARHLRALPDPNRAAFYTSGRTSNEAAFLWQLFARSFGTNNLPDCSNLCHESSGTALTEAIGTGKGTVRLSDFEYADVIFVIGQNPGSNHPRMLATLEQAKRRGARIISINPLNETGLKNFRNPQSLRGWVGSGTDLADLHVPVRINGDVAVFKGLCKTMLEAEKAQPGSVADRQFIERYTEGFDAWAADIGAMHWADIESAAGVDQAMIQKVAEMARDSQATICCWAMGLTQHENAVANIQAVVNFLLLQGNFGKPGAGACPVRGHSNVQGDRTMGIWERPEPEFLQRLGARFMFAPPSATGLDTVNTLLAMAAGRIDVLIALGGNIVAASPDTVFTESALSRCKLSVQVSTKLNRSHLATGETALILPVLTRSELDRQPGGEQFVTVENSMGLVNRSQGSLLPASPHLKSEVRVVAELADAVLGAHSDVRWRDMADDYDRIRDHIAVVIPGFERFNDRIYEDGFIELPHPVRDQREFPTISGKARFTVHPVAGAVAPEGSYLMTTLRSHDQFNTTVYSQKDRYRGITDSRDVVFMNAADMRSAGLSTGDRVTLSSHVAGERRSLPGFSVVAYEIPRGCVAAYYPEANPLVPVSAVAVGSNTPAYKSVPVQIAAD